MSKHKNIVVGAGFSGATIANLIAEKFDEEVLIVDKKSHIAGNSYDYFENNICVHKYGSHIFHTQSEKVWQFISKFTSFNTYMHKVIAVIDGIETTIPFNINSLYDTLPKTLAEKLEEKLLKQFEYNAKIPILEFQKQDDEDLKFLAKYVYEKVFLHYTIKQWGKAPDEIDGFVTARVPVYISRDNRYFQDKYQGIPQKGYSETVKNMLNHPKIKIELNTDFKNIDTSAASKIFYTGSIDEFFNYKFGVLPYRSINFKMEKYEDREFYQSNSVVNYPCDYDFTRIHEYKHYLKDKSSCTIIAKEYSEDFELNKNERYYPVSNKENEALYQKYLMQAEKLENVYFLGRLGDYKYYDMDKAILRAIELFEKIYDKRGNNDETISSYNACL